MRKINTNNLSELSWSSPKGKFVGSGKQVYDGAEDLVVYVMADNPIGESSYFPDSKKWTVRSPERRVIRSDDIDYYDGEE
jgi:hypothetical protein